MASAPGPVEVVLLDEDDLMHEVEDVGHFNESAYYNFFDDESPVGGWVRIGNRPNEGYAEMSVCLYEPDGTACFQFKRPQIEGNAEHAAGGLRFEVADRWKHHRIGYDRSVCFLRDPFEMAEPSVAFKKNPQVPVKLELDWFGQSPGWGGEPRRRSESGAWEPARLGDPEKQFARGHFEQLGRVEGSLEVDGRRHTIRGHGLRDHSWGPRFWQNTGYYRWLPISIGSDDFGMMAVVSETPEGERGRGFVFRDGEIVQVKDVELETDFGGPQDTQRAIQVRLHAEDGEVYEVEGRVISLVPCRNRRGGWVTRISEGMTEWRCRGHRGYGMSEYLDHLVKGE